MAHEDVELLDVEISAGILAVHGLCQEYTNSKTTATVELHVCHSASAVHHENSK